MANVCSLPHGKNTVTFECEELELCRIERSTDAFTRGMHSYQLFMFDLW